MDRRLSRHPTREEMEREIERSLAWRRRERPVARLYGGLCIAPYHYRHFDQLLADIGVSAGTGNPVSAYLGPIDPADYGRRLQSAPSYRIEARPDAPAADGPASSGPVGQPA
jgi:hypothetical protein